MSEITREFASNSHKNQYQQGDFKADPFVPIRTKFRFKD